jgi:hypothetical protein
MVLLRTPLIAAALVGSLLAPAVAKPLDADAAPPTVMHEACSWNRPGVDPFMGDVVAAVDRYRDIPAEVRARLKARMAKRQYDDLVSIRRDSIDGRAGYQYGGAISDMHFGTNQVCHSVTRAAWTPAMQERGLVYCEAGHCILVPTVCRNVSRIGRKGVLNERAEAPPESDEPEGPRAAPPGAVPASYAGEPTVGPLAFDASPSFASPLPWNGTEPRSGPTNSPGDIDPGEPGHPGPWPPGHVDHPPPVVPTPVPEPQTWALLLLGLASLALARRRQRRRAAA